MAIIKTLLLQDAVRLVGRLRIWTLLFALCCINYAWGTVPGTPVITVSGSGFVTIAAKKYSQTNGQPVTLACLATCASCTSHYEFTQDGNVVQNYSATTDYAITSMAASHAGVFKCNARDAGKTTDKSESVANTLTLTCATANTDTVCGPIGICHEDANSKLFCQCKLDAAQVYLSGCNECDGGNACAGGKKCSPDTPLPRKCVDCLADGDCKTTATPWCDATVANEATCKKCKVETKGAHKGCDPDSATPRCNNGPCASCSTNGDGDKFCKGVNTAKPKCGSSGKCEADPSASTPASGGSTEDGGATDSKGTTAAVPDSKTSSAGTVTYTACLVIASVVVALMN